MLDASLLGLADLAVYALLFAISAGETSAFLGLLVPGETAVLTAGVLASQGQLDLAPLIASVVVGAVTGDQIGYLLGRRHGGRWIDRFSARSRWRRRQLRVRSWMRGRYGGLTVLTGRFVGYIRPLVPFAAGAAGMRYRLFVLYGVPAAVVWGVGSVLVGVVFGTSGERVIQTVGTGVVIGVAAVLLPVLLVLRARARRGRLNLLRVGRGPVYGADHIPEADGLPGAGEGLSPQGGSPPSP